MIKVILFIVSACVFLTACHPGSPDSGERKVEEIPLSGSFSNAELIRNPVSLDEGISAEKMPVMHFRDTLFNFGTVREGEIVEYAFKFTNTGKSPLLIARARSTCGCTVPEWPEEPIAPGESGTIKARFDTEGKTGSQMKPITIMANTLPGSIKVYLVGEVTPAVEK